MKKTPWYPGDVKPLPDRKGSYECKPTGASLKFAQADYWNGEMWCDPDTREPYSNMQDAMEWRGLAADPLSGGVK